MGEVCLLVIALWCLKDFHFECSSFVEPFHNSSELVNAFKSIRLSKRDNHGFTIVMTVTAPLCRRVWIMGD